MDVIQTRVSIRGKRKTYQPWARYWFRSSETGTDPAPMISAFTRLPLPVTKEAAGTWTATATKDGMAATAIAAFAPLDSTETSPLPGTGTERAKARSVGSDRLPASGFLTSMATADWMAAVSSGVSLPLGSKETYPWPLTGTPPQPARSAYSEPPLLHRCSIGTDMGT